jgi:hypothetical protein
LETGDRRLEVEGWRLEIGDWRLEARCQKQEAGKGFADFYIDLLPQIDVDQYLISYL